MAEHAMPPPRFGSHHGNFFYFFHDFFPQTPLQESHRLDNTSYVLNAMLYFAAKQTKMS